MKTLQADFVSPGLLQLQAAAEKRDTRRRRVLSFGLVVPGENHPGLDCTIRDVSEGGARIGFARSVSLPAQFWLIEIRARMAYRAEVAWRNDLEAGLCFHEQFALGAIANPHHLFLKKLWLQHATR